MKLSLLKYSAWISVACMISYSCSSSRILISGDQAGKMRKSFISGSFEKSTFKAKVTFHENELSGLMLIKKTGDGNYKLALYNELGMTYMEATYENSSKHKNLIIKNIAPVIDHKSFINSFKKSLQIVFSNKPGSRFPASPPPAVDEDKLIVKLRNGFLLELKP